MYGQTTMAAGRQAGHEVQDCERSGHPLELIAFFRRFKPSLGRDLIYTLIWNTAFVVVFTIFAMLFDPA